MKETTIAFVVFFSFVFLVVMIRAIKRGWFSRLFSQKNPTFILFSKIYRSKKADFDCDCGGADCGDADCGGDCGGGGCDGADYGGAECSGCDGYGSNSSSDCSDCDYCCFGTYYYGGCGPSRSCDDDRGMQRQDRRRKERQRASRQIAYDERRAAERRWEEEKKYREAVEQIKTQRLAEVEELKQAGYIASEEEINSVIDLVSTNPKTGLLWTSTVVKLPIAKIMIIVDDQEEYAIIDEYIINRKMVSDDKFNEMLQKKDDTTITKEYVEGNCQFCGNPYEPDNVYCLNCGAKLEKVEKVDTIVSTTTPEERLYQTTSLPLSQQETRTEEADRRRRSRFNYLALFAFVNWLVAVIYYILDVIFAYNLNGLIISPILIITSAIFAAISMKNPNQKTLSRFTFIMVIITIAAAMAVGILLLTGIIFWT